MGVNATHERSVKHVRKVNIADVNAASRKEPARLVGLDLAAYETG